MGRLIRVTDDGSYEREKAKLVSGSGIGMYSLKINAWRVILRYFSQRWVIEGRTLGASGNPHSNLRS